MSIETSSLRKFLHEVAQRVMAEQPESLRLELEDETPIVGTKGGFDSIALLSFLIEVEQSVEEKYGVRVSLADDKALAQPVVPFKNIARLADYLHAVLTGKAQTA
jgi:hypothetical protein